MVDPTPVASVTEHLRDAYGFTIKSAATGLLFRVLPLRDPGQPRFWCVVAVRSLPGGDIDRSHPAWIGRRGLRREELASIMAAIRDDLEAWLADPAQDTLRAWVMTPDAEVVTPDAGPHSSPDRSVASNNSSKTSEAGIARGSQLLGASSDNAVAGAVA